MAHQSAKKYKLSYLVLSKIPGKKAMEVAETDIGRVLKTMVDKSQTPFLRKAIITCC